jgi:hypothetical protein
LRALREVPFRSLSLLAAVFKAIVQEQQRPRITGDTVADAAAFGE